MEEKMADSSDDIQAYRQMLKLDRRSRVFTLLAEELCAAGEWEQAAEVCKKGLLFHPDHLRSRVLLGWALMEMGDSDQSERILLKAVDDIRKNSIIFKLLSEFAALSGKTETAGEYARIYEGFQTPGPIRGVSACAPELDHSEPALAPKKEASEWDDFKAEAMAELRGASDSDTVVMTPEMEPRPKLGIEDILAHLAQRIEGRFTQKTLPSAILSEDDRNMLKEKIVAVLSA
jgi:tetratricopeptide (TPR) repeat protein